ncbi:hypothetical protein [Methylosarcina fibrata]|uniref:hypothetical protein n=1 Tax=Methylosarcina fibrata TaxID=105972 RepID=UPI0003606B02|nr:hypothetical protein [Methylosarcina fibrata]
MHKLIAGFILMMVLPIVGKTEAPTEVQPPESAPIRFAGALPPSAEPVKTSPGDTGSGESQSEAYQLCLRATKLFDQQEKAQGNTKTEVTSLSTACEEKLKPAAYWQCMEKQAMNKIDFNTAHWRCGKQTKVVE